ncbi:MAG: transporter substrate-binding protein [Sedimentibacter sp.]|nr:transporter substrate-binding protein [Sedimentibacter sp.]
MKFKKSLALLMITASFLTACSGGEKNEAPAKDEPKQLIVSTFAIGEDEVNADIIQPFEEANNCEIILETGNSGERFTKFSTNPNSGIDVIELAQNNNAQAVEAGLFDKLDSTKVTNLIYNPQAAGMEIDEWSDLWDSSLAGKIAIPDMTITYGPHMLHVASEYAKTDITSDNGAAAFKAIEELKPNVVKTYTKSSDLANMFQTGEISVAVVGDFALPLENF